MCDNIMIMRDGAVSQMGTPEEIVAKPADSYVADFTEDVPRYKVLSAGKVMRAMSAPLNGNATTSQQTPVQADTKIDQLIDRVIDTDQAIPVVDHTGAICGEIDRTIILQAMNT